MRTVERKDSPKRSHPAPNVPVPFKKKQSAAEILERSGLEAVIYAAQNFEEAFN